MHEQDKRKRPGLKRICPEQQYLWETLLCTIPPTGGIVAIGFLLKTDIIICIHE
jgi:hypothetical protein